tara:strand:+ start:747 stop:956 length:210 start_codon:yes stop_codon:yes gene_type:complete
MLLPPILRRGQYVRHRGGERRYRAACQADAGRIHPDSLPGRPARRDIAVGFGFQFDMIANLLNFRSICN